MSGSFNETNLYITYKKVKQRIGRAKSKEERIAAEAAKVAAKSVIDKPTLTNVKIFRAKEMKWLRYASMSARLLADEFENAIRSKSYKVERSFMKTNHTGWAPKKGIVYCLTCLEMPGCVKVGATTLKLEKRLQLYARHSLSQLSVPFKIETDNPSLVEERAQRILSKNRVRGPNGGQSSEWFRVTVDEASRAIVAAKSDD